MSQPAHLGGRDDRAVVKHVRLREWLEELADRLPPDSPVPSERALAEQFAISRGTVRRAVDTLVEEGVLARAPGRGTFTAPVPPPDRLLTEVHLASFTQDMVARGLRPDTRVLALDKTPPTPGPRAHLGVAACWRLVRLRQADDRPIAYEEAYLRADLLPDLDAAYDGGSVYAMAATRYDVPVDAAEQVVWAEPADDRLATLLGLRTGDPLLVFERRSTSRGRPVEFATSWYRADRYSLLMSLSAT